MCAQDARLALYKVVAWSLGPFNKAIRINLLHISNVCRQLKVVSGKTVLGPSFSPSTWSRTTSHATLVTEPRDRNSCLKSVGAKPFTLHSYNLSPRKQGSDPEEDDAHDEERREHGGQGIQKVPHA